MICTIEQAALVIINYRSCAGWFGAADRQVRDAAASVNGHVFASLLEKGKYVDAKCVDSFREGHAANMARVAHVFCFSFRCRHV